MAERVWTLDIGVEEAEIRSPNGSAIIARHRRGHPIVSDETWQFIIDALNEKEQNSRIYLGYAMAECGCGQHRYADGVHGQVFCAQHEPST